MPRYIRHGLCQNFPCNYLMMELCEETVLDYLVRNPAALGQKCVQMLSCIEALHKFGVIHRDIKPTNFMMRGDDVVIIDFGTHKEYRDKNGNHIPEKNTLSLQGTVLFASINALEKKELSRRDDLECLGFSILYLNNEKQLPWHDGTEEV